jgi:sulfonate transport system permease protein
MSIDQRLAAPPPVDLRQPASPARPASQPPASRARKLTRSKSLRRLVSPVALLLLWQAVSTAGLISAQKLPPPTEIWHTALTLITTDSPAYGTLQGAMLISLERVAIGFVIGGTLSPASTTPWGAHHEPEIPLVPAHLG